MKVDAEGAAPVNEELSNLRRNDVIVAVVLWVCSLFALFDSIRLTFDIELAGVTGVKWLVAPGLLPMFFSAGLLFMLTWVILTASKQGVFSGHFTAQALWSKISRPERVNKLLQVILLSVFVLLLVGNLHFGVASAIYLIGAMTLSRAAKFYQIVLIAVIFSGLVTYLFGTVMKLPLP